MKKQKGQSAVELAIILPMFFTLVFAVFYVGIMFMDYIQFSNAARAAARDISLAPSKSDTQKEFNKENIIEKLNAQDETTISKYAAKLTNLYDAKFKAKIVNKDENNEDNEDSSNDKKEEVVVTVTFERNDDNFPTLLYYMNFPPKTLGAITYKMPIEQ